MAVTGVFAADFVSFFDAVDTADIKLKALETGGAKVESSLSRMANSFSGQKVIQDATQMVRIFDEMGGAAGFTEKELARMNTTATEAIAKLKALGQDVPDGLQKMANETKTAAKETDTFAGSVTNLVKSFAVMSALRMGVDWVKDMAAAAGALNDLSAQTQINVESLQRMGNAMSEFGVDTEELGRALFTLSARIGKGDEGVADALTEMGLSIEEVKGLHGEELFLVIQRALGQLDGQLRDTTAVELYGSKLGMMLAGAAAQTDDAIAKQKELNLGWSQESVEALDAAGEAWDRFVAKITALAVTNVLGPIAEGMNDFIEASEKAGTSATFWASLKDRIAEFYGFAPGAFADLTAKLDAQAAAAREAESAARALAGAWESQGPPLSAYIEQVRAEKDAREAATKADRDAVAAKERLNEQYAKLMSDTKNRQGLWQMEDDRLAMVKEQTDKQQAAVNALQTAYGTLAKQQAAARESAAALADQEKVLEADYQATVVAVQDQAQAHTDAGVAASEATAATVAGYQQVQQQVTLTLEHVEALIKLRQFELELAAAAASYGGLYPSSGKFAALAAVAGGTTLGIPSFQGGVTNFGGGLAKVHQNELLVNLPGGTSVIPGGRGGGASITNVFHLVDTESNLARRVSEEILRTVRAGTQLGTA